MDTQNGEIWALSALLKVKHGTGFKAIVNARLFYKYTWNAQKSGPYSIKSATNIIFLAVEI